MRMCLKCSKKVSDESKICRNCGAILEDVPDDFVPGTDSELGSAFLSGSPFASEPQEPGVTGDDQPLAGEIVVESQQSPPPITETSAWKCPHCGESIPGTFDVCWKCSTTRDGEKAEGSESEFFLNDPDASKPDEKPEPIEFDDEPLRAEDDNARTPALAGCSRCGSAKMMLGVTIVDGGGTPPILQVVICGDPSALIFKDRLFGELEANICGDCGHVELRVTNPQELYRHYRKSSR